MSRFHPEWSASAVNSAIMTTAWTMNASKTSGAEFACGAGFVNPTVVVDPGLVYEIAKEDYLNMLCTLDYSSNGISTITVGTFSCSENLKLTMSMRNLNYPSMAARVSPSSSSDITFSRTVTNVGNKGSTYKANLSGDPKLSIKVEPDSLSHFLPLTVSGKNLADIFGIVSASLVWSDGSHKVRSPIVVYT